MVELCRRSTAYRTRRMESRTQWTIARQWTRMEELRRTRMVACMYLGHAKVRSGAAYRTRRMESRTRWTVERQ